VVQNKGKRHSDHPFDLLNAVSGFLDLTETRPAIHTETATRGAVERCAFGPLLVHS